MQSIIQNWIIFQLKLAKIYRLVMNSIQNVSLMNQQETVMTKFVAHTLDNLQGRSFFIEVAQFENQSHFQFMVFCICILLKKRIQESSIKYQQKQQLIQKIVTFQQESLNNQNQCYKIKIQEFQELLKKKLQYQENNDSEKIRDIDDQLELKLQEQFFKLLKFNPEKKGQKFSIFSKYQFEVMLKTLKTTDKSSQKVSLLKFILQTLLYNHSFVILFGSKAWSQDFINTVFQYLQYIKSIPLIQNIQEPQKLIQQIQKFYQMKNKSSTYKSFQNMIKKTIEQWTNNSYFVFMGKNFQHPQLLRFSEECYFGLHLQKNLLKIVIEQIQSDRHSENIKVYLKQIKQILDITSNQK